ncbi:Bug family tripartite tricarboxylate transporter substrate binding protein [Rhodoplanes sp. Z2-YC6860]|uniref:Bug family tripartite tricarboxylate transporter substrate binding protein n=1 Tax=Rhodoplanes sp. Z2-YC6860 TaxID=674703 RepID=UPI00078CDE88|nr:tripartite tricarboxylate transporter substrate binding protein [Rhodoplanes sp. Z2-YC6860]AMN42217.1 extra-cytoplasmic solute receptor [Rhodoplanes sp. Z2-YC6860]
MKRTGAAVLAALLLGLASPSFAQSWPTRPIQIVVSSGAGGTADIMARIIGDRLSPVLGQPIVIENRLGAGGHVGATSVARANPDGYTLLMSGQPTHSVGPYLFKNLQYDPMRDVPPVAMIAVAPNLLVVNASSPIKSVSDLVRLARERPGTLTYTSAGIGTSGYLAGELLKSRASLDMEHIPYKSGPEAVTGVLTGNVSFVFFTLPALLPQVEAGKLRALAIASAERSALVPNVPTIAEEGFPGFDVIAWFALFAPRGTPESVVARLSAEIEKIVAQPDVRAQMAKLGAEPRYLPPKGVVDFVAAEQPQWAKLLKDVKPAN